jgi:hypothetical protein
MAEPVPPVRATLVPKAQRRRVEVLVPNVLNEPATPRLTNTGPRDLIVCKTCGQPWRDHGRSPKPHPWVALRVPTSSAT